MEEEEEIEPGRTVKGDGAAGEEEAGGIVDECIEAIGTGGFQIASGLYLGLANAADAVIMMSVVFLLPVFGARALMQTVLTTAVFLGMLLGGLALGWLSDRLGRRRLVRVCLTLDILCGVLSALAPMLSSVQPDYVLLWLAVYRFIGGVGIGGSTPSVFTLAAEYSPRRWRGALISTVAVFWMVGAMYASAVAWLLLPLVDDAYDDQVYWRLYLALCSLPSVVSLVLSLGFPESPRFLFLRGHVDEAYAAFETMARWNRSIELLPSLDNFRLHARSELGEGAAGQMAAVDASAVSTGLDGVDGSPVRGRIVRWGLQMGSSVQVAWAMARLLFSREWRRPMLLLLAVWFALNFGWYGLNSWIPVLFEKEDISMDVYQAVFLVQVAALPGNIASLVLVDWVGRKWLLGGAMLASAAVGLLFAFSAGDVMVVLSACLFSAVSIMGWNSLECVTTESFPTALRNTAVGALTSFGRIGSIFAQLVNGLLVEFDNVFLLLIVTSGMVALGALLALFIPREPKGKPLRDAA